MRPYQKKLYEIFKNYCQPPGWPTYPPYHEGMYLEEYFIEHYRSNAPETGRYFIPIHWSACYINNNDRSIPALQEALRSIDQEKSYFIVSTHDDAPRESLPSDTLCYSGGGNSGTVPIPLVVSKIPNKYLTKEETKIHLASFIGSVNTHQIRGQIYQRYKDRKGFYFSQRAWSEKVSNNQLEDFIDQTKKSHFGLAPRGYGKTSYRMYEIMQLGSVPVYVSDDFWLPWAEEFDWDKAIIKCKPEDLDILDLTLQDCLYSGEYEEKLNYIRQSYDKYFTIQSTTEKIIKEIQK